MHWTSDSWVYWSLVQRLKAFFSLSVSLSVNFSLTQYGERSSLYATRGADQRSAHLNLFWCTLAAFCTCATECHLQLTTNSLSSWAHNGNDTTSKELFTANEDSAFFAGKASLNSASFRITTPINYMFSLCLIFIPSVAICGNLANNF
jgi:hypothetical protein